MASQYTYRPIHAQNSIRLIELSPGYPDDPRVHCNIRHTNLDAFKLAFEPVSYTWGDPNERQTVYCGNDNAEIEVPANCVTALRYLRHDQTVRILWIDAICIDQSNLTERNAQVRIMGEIFAAGIQTIIFLGESTPESSKFFSNLAMADDWIRRGRSTALLQLEQDFVPGLEHLLSRPWFSRVWVIQELFRSKKAIFVCGQDSASYEAILDCLFGYSRNTRITRARPAPLEVKRTIARWHPHTEAQELYSYLSLSSLCASTDPRDRVIALVPLISAQQPRLELLVDYAKSTETIFRDLALFFLADEMIGIHFLEMIHHPHSRIMPSWIPDWSQHFVISFEFVSLGLTCSCQNGFPYEIIDRGTPSPLILVLSGFRWSYIAELGPVIKFDDREAGPSYKTAFRDEWNAYTAADETRSALMLQFQDHPEFICRALDSLDTVSIGTFCTKGRGSFMTLSNGKDSFILTDDNTDAFRDACNGNRICLTTDGELGIVSRYAQLGDTLCLFRGARLPCLLRECASDRWTLISGNCYIEDNPNLGSLATQDLEEFHIC